MAEGTPGQMKASPYSICFFPFRMARKRVFEACEDVVTDKAGANKSWQSGFTGGSSFTAGPSYNSSLSDPANWAISPSVYPFPRNKLGLPFSRVQRPVSQSVRFVKN